MYMANIKNLTKEQFDSIWGVDSKKQPLQWDSSDGFKFYKLLTKQQRLRMFATKKVKYLPLSELEIIALLGKFIQISTEHVDLLVEKKYDEAIKLFDSKKDEENYKEVFSDELMRLRLQLNIDDKPEGSYNEAHISASEIGKIIISHCSLYQAKKPNPKQ